jgi:hypothetical protein
MLTQKRLKELMNYNPDTGIFTWAVPKQSIRLGDVAGSLHSKGYITIKIDGNSYLSHRLAWLYMTGHWPENQIDHKKGIKHDNRFYELRDLTNKQNCQNRIKPNSNNSSGFLGVSWSKKYKKWQASIMFDGKTKFLGYSKTPEEAYHKYLTAKSDLSI